ncbi:MAG: sulfite exporter TauE/SafE family protein [Campylobacter sp.]|nr:sulfite exporter TauE/SafE family protein [Campylobacter sp.]
MNELNLLNIALMSFLLSFGHCVFMCGGFVLAYSTKLAKKTKNEFVIYSFCYHFFRVLAYVLLGLVAGFVGSIVSFSVVASGYIKFVVGMFLVVLGLGLIFRGEILKFIENDKIWSKFLQKPTKFAMSSNSLSGFCLLGFLNGFLPCGVVYTFLGMTIMANSAFYGALIMFVFGICTMPVMIGIGFGAKIGFEKFSKFSLYISGALIIAYGLYSAFMGFMQANG